MIRPEIPKKSIVRMRLWTSKFTQLHVWNRVEAPKVTAAEKGYRTFASTAVVGSSPV